MTLARIERVEAGEETLMVWLEGDSQPLHLPWFWVKDHSRDVRSFDSETRQRTIDSFSIDLDCAATGARLVDGDVHVDWGD